MRWRYANELSGRPRSKRAAARRRGRCSTWSAWRYASSEDVQIRRRGHWHALEQRESEIVAGHGVFRYGGYLTVTGRNEEDLEQAVAGMRNALSTAAMEAQILYNQQAEALMVNALPIGRGLK